MHLVLMSIAVSYLFETFSTKFTKVESIKVDFEMLVSRTHILKLFITNITTDHILVIGLMRSSLRRGLNDGKLHDYYFILCKDYRYNS